MTNTHRMLYIEEILLNIFGHCAPPVRKRYSIERRRYTTDLVALARTCRTFKEPALDVLWEDLDDLSLLVRCLPDAHQFNVDDSLGYSFSRPLTEAEWNTLRGYTRRVRHICSYAKNSLNPSVLEAVLTLAPFTPLFPSLRSIYWDSSVISSLVVHIAVPSLVSLRLKFVGLPPPSEVFDIIGERCPNIKWFCLYDSPSGSLDGTISRQICRWKNLQSVNCHQVTLNVDAILHLCSLPVTQLSFILSDVFDDRISRFGFLCVFSELRSLIIESRRLKSVTSLFSRIRLPVIEDLVVLTSEYASRREVQAYWTTVQKACPFNSLTHLSLSACNDGRIEEPIGFNEWLTLDDLCPYRDFGNLLHIEIDLAWSVWLPDAHLLDLVSASPQLKILSINEKMGWKMGERRGGITLSGLVQLLRQCPDLEEVALAIDTLTFTHIPQGLYTSFECVGEFEFLDSYISPALVPSLATVFLQYGLDPEICSLEGGNCVYWNPEEARAARALWRSVKALMMEEIRAESSTM